MIQTKQIWRWGFVGLVAFCTLALFALYLSAVLDKQVGPFGKAALLVIAGIGIAATLLAGGGIIERRRGLLGLLTPKAASLIFVAIIGVFGLLTDVYGFLQPRPAVESDPGKIERTTDAILGALSPDVSATPAERTAWLTIEPGDCDQLRAHIERFPDGAYAPQAAARLAARRTIETEVWTQVSRPLPPRIVEPGSSEPTEEAAKAEALARGEEEAKTLCSGFAAGSLYRFRGVSVSPDKWNCTSSSRGFACGFTGATACDLDVRSVLEEETCDVAR